MITSKNRILFNNAKSLNLPIGKHAIFGSGPMGVRNMREISDIDIVVTEEIYNEYKGKECWHIKNIEENNNCFKGLVNHNLNIEMWKDWYTDWNVNTLIETAEIINDMPFVRLDYVIKWKKFFAKEKDLRDVEIIESYLLEDID